MKTESYGTVFYNIIKYLTAQQPISMCNFACGLENRPSHIIILLLVTVDDSG